MQVIEEEGMTTRRVFKQATMIVNGELDALYRDKRDNHALIKSQMEQIRLMRERAEKAEDKQRIAENKQYTAEETQNKLEIRNLFLMIAAVVSWIGTLISVVVINYLI